MGAVDRRDQVRAVDHPDVVDRMLQGGTAGLDANIQPENRSTGAPFTSDAGGSSRISKNAALSGGSVGGVSRQARGDHLERSEPGRLLEEARGSSTRGR